MESTGFDHVLHHSEAAGLIGQWHGLLKILFSFQLGEAAESMGCSRCRAAETNTGMCAPL